MQVRHDTSGRWWVAAKWPDGLIEDVEGFKSETEANEWIATEFDNWLNRRREGNAGKEL
jgi:hypothetical protein